MTIPLWIVTLLMLSQPENTRSQNCEPNMLHLTGGYAAARGAAVKLTSAFTVEGWINVTEHVDNAAIIERRDKDGNATFSLRLGANNSFIGRVQQTGSAIEVIYTPPSSLSGWHHFALSFFSGDSLRLYLDGSLVGRERVTPSSLVASTDSIRIGANAATGARFLGSIDELRIWDSRRSITEINRDRSQTLAPSPSLVAYFSFDDERASLFAHDFAGRNNDAVLNAGSALALSTSPVTEVTRGYKLEARESSIDFGTAVCGASSSRIIHVRNRGRDTVWVDRFGFSRGQAFSIAAAGFALPPDTTYWREVTVFWNGGPIGLQLDTLTISADGNVCAGIVAIALKGRSLRASANALPLTLDFGTRVNCELPQGLPITLQNTGDVELTLDSVVFENVVGLTAPAGVKVLPGASSQLTITLQPGAQGSFQTRATFYFDKCQLTSTINVRGSRNQLDYTISPPSIDRTLKAQLGGVTVFDTMEIENRGTAAIAISSMKIDSANYRLIQPIGTQILPGKSLRIPIRFQATLCGDYKTTLRIIGRPCGFDTSISLRTVIAPVTIASSDSVDVGLACTSKDDSILFENTSGQTVILRRLDFDRPGIFHLKKTSSLPDTLLASEKVWLPIHFEPRLAGRYSVKGLMDIAPCGTTETVLMGSVGVEGISTSYSDIDFGRGCGKDSTVTIEIFNTSNNDLRIDEADLSRSDVFDRGPGSFVVPAHGSAFYKIRYAPLEDDIADDTLTFTSNGCLVQRVHLHGSREDASIAFDKSTLNFDTVCPFSAKALDITLTNSGRDSVDILDIQLLQPGSEFQLVATSTVVPKGNASARFTLAFRPEGPRKRTATLRLTTCSGVVDLAIEGAGDKPEAPEVLSNSHIFEKVKVSTSGTFCIPVINNSCMPIEIDAGSLPMSAEPFHFSDITLASLPISIVRGDTALLCLEFRPTRVGIFQTEFDLKLGSEKFTLRFSGEGVASNIVISDTVINFPLTHVDSARSIDVVVRNLGNASAELLYVMPTAPFVFEGGADELAIGSEFTAQVRFRPTATGAFFDSVVISVDGTDRRIFLRGEAGKSGVIVTPASLEFGEVHLSQSVTKSLAIVQANEFETTVLGLEFVGSTDTLAFAWSSDKALPYTFDGPTDTLRITFEFKPTIEKVFSSPVVVRTGGETQQFLLAGEGIEAHATLSRTAIDFGEVPTGEVREESVVVTNTGKYPLQLFGVESDLIEYTATIPLSPALLSGESRELTVSFRPYEPGFVSTSMKLLSSAPEQNVVTLIGVGGFSDRFVYHLPSDTLLSGRRFWLPIKLSSNLSQDITSDSLFVSLVYDHYAISIDSISTIGTMTENHIVSSNVTDSSVNVSAHGLSGGWTNNTTLFYLTGRALLTDRNLTKLTISEVLPANTSSPENLETTLFITDCVDPDGGVRRSADFSIKHFSPNPSKDEVVLEFELDLDRPVTVELRDVIGKRSAQLYSGNLRRGANTLHLSVSDFPSGSYQLTLNSNYFIQSVPLVIAR